MRQIKICINDEKSFCVLNSLYKVLHQKKDGYKSVLYNIRYYLSLSGFLSNSFFTYPQK